MARSGQGILAGTRGRSVACASACLKGAGASRKIAFAFWCNKGKDLDFNNRTENAIKAPTFLDMRLKSGRAHVSAKDRPEITFQ
ncbi:hypothetical protein THAOC_26622, partial [Thalassiosira oceanica]